MLQAHTKSESGRIRFSPSTVDVELPLFFCVIRILQSLSLSPLFSWSWKIAPRHHNGPLFNVRVSCYTLRSWPIVDVQINKNEHGWTTNAPCFFLHTIDSWPHLSSRVARLRTNKKVKANLGRFGSHGFGMPLEVPNLTDLLVHLAHLQEKATRQKTQIVGYGMLPHIWSYLCI